MFNVFQKTKKSNRHYGVALWVGFLGGNIASFVKWGIENPFPPRTPERAIPPAELLENIGVNVNTLVYHYSEHVINWGVAGIHHGFSIFFAMLYCYISEIFPKIKLWQGAFFGLCITILFHGGILPLWNLAPPIWELPWDELISETVGHLCWIWTIEIFRRDIRNRITHEPDPEYLFIE
jgi:putative membrane protein